MNISGISCLVVLLFIGFLSLSYSSPVNNDNNNQRQAPVTNTIINQPTPVIVSTQSSTSLTSTNIQWIRKLKNITEYGGRKVILECQVQSSYPVSFNWYRYNNPIDKRRFLIHQTAFRSSIILNSLKDVEAGFYTCEVSNGYETITSTGFVRIKNPIDIDQLGLNDDVLPSDEFQPEIMVNDDKKINRLKCEQYQGHICRSIISSQYISVENHNQDDIENNLVKNAKRLLDNEHLTKECRLLLLPMICSFTFPICDNDRTKARSICRSSCLDFRHEICPNLLKFVDVPLLQNMPTCEDLPPTSDDSTCIDFEQIFLKNKTDTSSSDSDTKLISPFSLPATSPILVPSLILVALVMILILILIICRCCRIRNSNRHLSPCSSTSTPIRKSSHLINTVTSSPFRSTITSNVNKQNLRQVPSSSSSTNTNFTNTYLRHTLLKSESKHPNAHHPLLEDTLLEIPYTNIRFLQELGEGDYGRIYKGELIDSTKKCIIKALQAENATPQLREEYAREIEIFRHILHPNISCLIGICIQPQDALSLMIYERLNDGDLHEYLLQRSATVSLYQQRDLADFLCIAIQIISGMVYLSEKKLVHNDLSAKNILISEHMDIKISNVARYRPKYDSDYYKIANRSLPVRWMAIESLLSGIYSEMSDVWSFGVLLWEMFSYGTQPYYGRTNPEVIEMVRDRKLLTCPANCPKRIYALMYSCWEELSEQRPTFAELLKRFRQFEDKSTTLSSTTSSSLVDVPPLINPGDSHTPKYRTFISPQPASTFVRNDVLSSSGRVAPPSMLADRDSIRFEI